MSTHAYPPSAAVVDLIRAGLGGGTAAVPLVAIDTPSVVAVVLVAIVALFVALAIRAAMLPFMRFEVNDAGINARGPTLRALSWRHLERIRLAYYSTRRDRSHGWLQLTLTDNRHTLAVDSRLNDFIGVATHAAAAARTKGLSLDAATRSNLEALGLPIPDTMDDGR
jgi:hypothetical protein